MAAVETLFPVVFMIGLGALARVRGWVTPAQKDGANNIVFNILFPVMIFNIMFTATLQASAALVVVYVFAAFCLAVLAGALAGKFTGERFAHISRFMMATCEGGNVALPLYTSIVGMAYASNTVIFDLAGSLIAFVVFPVLVAKSGAGKAEPAELAKKIFGNSFVITFILALTLNLTGCYRLLSGSPLFGLYNAAVSMATAPIVGMILFIIGFNLNLDMGLLGPVLRSVALRLLTGVCIIAGFFFLFPSMMAESTYRMAVILYFTCPTGFAVPMIISPLYRSGDDERFTAAMISCNMVVTLAVYAAMVVLAA